MLWHWSLQPLISDLVSRKTSGKEKEQLTSAEFDGLFKEAKKLEAELHVAAEAFSLPDEVQNFEALNDFLIRIRKSGNST